MLMRSLPPHMMYAPPPGYYVPAPSNNSTDGNNPYQQSMPEKKSLNQKSSKMLEEPDFERADGDFDRSPYKLNSVLDWLDHRRSHQTQHQVKVKAALERSVEKLDREQQQREEREKDWAQSKIDRIGKLLKSRQIGGLPAERSRF